MDVKIAKTTELGPADILRNRKGKIYRIETFHGDKNTFRVSPWPAKPGEENPSYVIISRESMIAKQWEKLDKDNIKLPSEEPVAEEVLEAVTEEKDSEENEDEKEDENEEEEEDEVEEEKDSVYMKNRSSEEEYDY